MDMRVPSNEYRRKRSYAQYRETHDNISKAQKAPAMTSSPATRSQSNRKERADKRLRTNPPPAQDSKRVAAQPGK